jgi:hypothetical protein
MAVYELKLFQPALQPRRLHAHFTRSLKTPSCNRSPFCTCHLTTAQGGRPRQPEGRARFRTKTPREWVVSMRDQCANASVPFFFKQWGGFHKKRAGRMPDGRTYVEFLERLRPAPFVDEHFRCAVAWSSMGRSRSSWIPPP